jgi:hypothetical protein
MEEPKEEKRTKAPRFKNSITTPRFYKAYKKDYPDSKVNVALYSKIIQSFNQAVIDKILEDQFEFEMPYRLGTLRIRKQKHSLDPAYLHVDWKASKEAGVRVYHLNDHTDNYMYRWLLNKRVVRYRNKQIYSLTIVRAAKRRLAAILKDEARTIDYYE